MLEINTMKAIHYIMGIITALASVSCVQHIYYVRGLLSGEAMCVLDGENRVVQTIYEPKLRMKFLDAYCASAKTGYLCQMQINPNFESYSAYTLALVDAEGKPIYSLLISKDLTIDFYESAIWAPCDIDGDCCYIGHFLDSNVKERIRCSSFDDK